MAPTKPTPRGQDAAPPSDEEIRLKLLEILARHGVSAYGGADGLVRAAKVLENYVKS